MWNLTSGLLDPASFRNALLGLPIRYAEEPPHHGAHFYVHLTAICDVGCSHCMYSSNFLKPTGISAHLDATDIHRTLRYIADSRPAKVTITGGGEPFLELRNMLYLIRESRCEYLELITSANWARSKESATRILAQVRDAVDKNHEKPRIIIRSSIDVFHLSAHNPVPLEAYLNLVRAWLDHRNRIDLGFRGLLLEGDESVQQLARSLKADLCTVDSWNQYMLLPNGLKLPVTYNVMRFIGNGKQFRADLSGRTVSFATYFSSFESAPSKLLLGRVVNDAINAKYYPFDGVSITLDYDGTLYIFTATAPDRRCSIRTHDFEQSLRWFYADPITRTLLTEGPYWLCDVLRPVVPKLVETALETNDMCSLVETLLTDPRIRAFATVVALKFLLSSCKAHLLEGHSFFEQLEDATLHDLQQEAVKALECMKP